MCQQRNEEMNIEFPGYMQSSKNFYFFCFKNLLLYSWMCTTKWRSEYQVSWLRLSKFDFCRFNIYFYILGCAQRNEEVTIKFSSPTVATYGRINIFISSVLIIPFIFLDMHNEMKRWIPSLFSVVEYNFLFFPF